MLRARVMIETLLLWATARARAATTLTGLIGRLDEFEWEGDAMRWTPDIDRTAA